MRLGMQVRGAIAGLIYRKALSLPLSSLATTTTGQIVNLISNDAEKFDELAKFLQYLWVAPLQSIIAFILIYREVGVACVVGFAVMLLTIPLQTLMSRWFTSIRKNTIIYTDQRVKTVNEILLGAMVMKLYAWVCSFIHRMSARFFMSLIAYMYMYL
jgi:ATP-binding cassette subfamily C (CFTR/MRP) protein 4